MLVPGSYYTIYDFERSVIGMSNPFDRPSRPHRPLIDTPTIVVLVVLAVGVLALLLSIWYSRATTQQQRMSFASSGVWSSCMV